MSKPLPRATSAAKGTLRSPLAQGGLMDYLSRQFPTVFTQVAAIPHDTKSDAKDGKQTKRYPARSGLYKSGT